MIRVLLNVYILIVILDAILSFFPQFSKNQYRLYLKKISDYGLGPIRNKLPQNLPFDFSPLVLIALVQILILLW
jgi:YggT family protein